MSIFNMLEVSGSALSAQRQRAEVVAANMANAETTKTAEGGPYKRKQVVFEGGASPFRTIFAGFNTGMGSMNPGVRISAVVEDKTPPQMKYEPGNPDANDDGYVAYPAINPVQEMVDLMGAVRSYQLNASAVSASKQMIQQALDILRG